MSVLCPGPVDTEFQQKADIKVAKSILKVPTAKEVAEYAYQELMKGQTLIVPGLSNPSVTLLQSLHSEES